MKTKVHFRKWPSGNIIALFPEIPVDSVGVYCLSYEQIGQHGSANVELPNTMVAKPEEYAKLYHELTSIDYDLVVVKRITAKMNTIRRNATLVP